MTALVSKVSVLSSVTALEKQAFGFRLVVRSRFEIVKSCREAKAVPRHRAH